MVEQVSLTIEAKNKDQANSLINSILKYCEEITYEEERFTAWANDMLLFDNKIEIDSMQQMYYEDYEELKDRLFEYLAKENPECVFSGICEYTCDDEYNPSSFSKTYADGILLQTQKNKSQILILCKKTYKGKYEMPKQVTQIAEEAFKDCSLLKEIHISEKVKKIGKETFAGCTSLEKIVIPSTVNKIVGKAVFSGCDKLTVIAPTESCAASYAKENGIPCICGDKN